MDLGFSPEQDMLREVVRGLCAGHTPTEVVRELEDDPVGYPQEFWAKLGELGITGLVLPEELGGAGMSMLDATVVYEELGRALAPSPLFVSSVMCGGVLAAAGSDEQRQEWLPAIAAGDAIITPAWLEPEGGFGPAGVQATADADGDGYVLGGVKRHVHFAQAADRLVVLARTGGGRADVDLFLVDPSSDGVSLTQQHSLSGDTQFRVDLDGVRVAASDRIGDPGSGWGTWHATMLDGVVLLAAQAMGGAAYAHEITTQYAKDRFQFDKPLGAFQAIAHDLADAVATVDGGRILVHEAAWARDKGRSIDQLAPMAKLFATQTYRDVTAMAQQVFGGVGFTVEYEIQLYFRRAKQLQITWWDTRYLEELIAEQVLDEPALT